MPLTHRAKSDRGSSQSDQTAVPGMWLMHGVCIVVAKLFHNPLDPFLISVEDSIAHNFLEPSQVWMSASGQRPIVAATYSKAPCFLLS